MLKCTVVALLWSRTGGPRPDVRFVAVALVTEWCLTARIQNLLPLLCPRGAPMLRCTICCGCYAKGYILLLLRWTRSGAPMQKRVAVAFVSKWCSNVAPIRCHCFVVPQCHDLLLLWLRSGAPILKCTNCCHCFGPEFGAPVLR